jgi:hypothetical protein
MKAVDFYKLPRAIQDRFVGSVMSGFPPAPLLAAKSSAPSKPKWLALSAASFVALIVLARLGYGALDSALSLHSGRALPLYLLFVFGFAFGLVQAFARVVRERAYPYTSGVYLFPACVIDARDDQFVVYPTSDLSRVEAQGSGVRLVFPGGVDFVFPLGKASAAKAVVTDIEAARDRAKHAIETEDAKELVAVDPLHNPRFSSPVGPRDPYAIAHPPWGKLGPVVAGVIAVLLGPTLWGLRNRGSEAKMYMIAFNMNDTASYRQYMAHGEKYAEDVGGILLPRAELREAERQGTVDALLEYKKNHPNSKIANEVAASIRKAMLAELEKAKAAGTLAALQAFATRYPEHGIQPELTAATHAVYARELDAYKKKSPSKDKGATSFIERLFAFAEKHGPKVEVRFRRKAPTTMERADQYILKTPSFMGVATYPSRFFDDKHAVPREAALGKNLATQFGAGLAPELFQFEVGPLVTDADLPEPTVPTLFVTHVAEWSGHNYTSTRPRGSYIGVIFNFDASFVIPGDPKPFKFKTEIFRHAATQVLNNPDEPMLAPGQAEEKVYATMSDDAFEQFGKRFLANFFAPPPK